MHMLTLLYKQFAGNDLVHNADQIVNSHTENFIYNRSALTLGGGENDETIIIDKQRWWLHKDTRHSDQAQVEC